MQNIYPLFERNRILKKELLQSLRDYSFTHVQLEYQEYGQGIIRGCEVEANAGGLTVNPGIIKYRQFICLVMEKETIPYAPGEKMQYVKARVNIDRTCADYIAYQVDWILDGKEGNEENELELCRFSLRKGAQLRDRYTGFADMVTEYDTINLLHSSWGGLGGPSMSPAVTRYFAETLLSSENSQPEDRSFAYLCLSQPGALPMAVLSNYIEHKMEFCSDVAMNSQEAYEAMCAIIKMVRQGGGKGIKNTKEKHRILVD